MTTKEEEIRDFYFEIKKKYGPIAMLLYPSFLLALKLEALLDRRWPTDDKDKEDAKT